MKSPILMLSFFFSGLIPAAGLAQGYRVETRVYDDTPSADTSDRAPFTSLTLFQNGKVYDYSGDEVIIFERTARRFVILNLARSLQTTVEFDEIRHLLDLRRQECEEYIREKTESGHRDAVSIAKSLRFQLDPKFETTVDQGNHVLELKAESWKYHVSTHTWKDPDQVREYLEYADWTARLNFVLDPSSLFPEPRMALNETLREMPGEMPTTVILDLRPLDSRVLRAEHKFVMDLDSADRNLIATWEKAARSGSLARKSFRSYQQAVLLTQR